MSGLLKERFDCARDERGQMTVELAVMIPVLVAIAVIAMNAMLFFSECATFDRLARNAVRVFATSPAYGEDTSQSCAAALDAIEEGMGIADKNYLEASVSVASESFGQKRFRATLRFTPTLFGMGLKSSVFGVSLPQLEHSTELVVDVYKPGVLF